VTRVRGLASVAVLGWLVGGVPWALLRFGDWPITGLPRTDQLRDLADTALSDAAIFAVLTVAAWAVWASFTAAVLAESLAAARGVNARRLAVVGPLQRPAQALVAAVVLALTLPQGPRPAYAASSAVPTPRAATTEVIPVTAVTYATPVSVPETREAEADPADDRIITVARGDSAWSIAEEHLGDGMRWRELWDANRAVVQPDGSSWTDPQVLRSGWQLHLPPSDQPPAAPTADATSHTSYTVEQGDTLSELADEVLGDPLRYPEIYDASRHLDQPGGRHLTDPDLIIPGWTLHIPSEPAPTQPVATPAPPSEPPPNPPVASGPPVPPDPPTTATPATTTTQPRPTDDAPAPPSTGDASPAAADSDDRTARQPVGPLGIAGGFLAAGLLGAVATRRRVQRMRRTPGAQLPAVPDEGRAAADAAADLDIDLAATVDCELRMLGSALADGARIPAPIVATVDDGHLELLLDRSETPPPPGWSADAGGRIWRCPLRADLPDDPSPGPAWLPALVTIGSLEDRGLMVNAEAFGAIGITGDVAAASALARSVAVELALSCLADVPGVHLVGDAVGDLDGIPNVTTHRDLESALAAVEAQTSAIAGALGSTGLRTAAELRCRAPEEGWPPAVIVARAADSEDGVQMRLIGRCRERAGLVAFLIGGCPPGATEITVAADAASIPALGLHCAVQQLDEQAVASMASWLKAAEATPEIAEEEPLTLFPAAEVAGREGSIPDEPRLHLRLLGPVGVDGADVRPQQLALLCYLALHPDATADALRDAVWGGKAPTRERFLNTIHELRRVVGADVLPTSTDGRYRLRHVWCDATAFEQHLAAAAEAPSQLAAELRAALELVAGPPLTYESRHRRHYRWVDVGNHTSRWERIVADAAHDLATTSLDDGDVDLARWAAERGLIASPGSETLTCDLVSAHLAAGDRNTAERVVDEYSRTAEDLGLDDAAQTLHDLLEERRAS